LFQDKADTFFSSLIDLVGYDRVTNYIHMLGAGHLRYYLSKCRNLNRFQNQGWESYNALITAFWHHRMTKGGGKKESDRSKILPFTRWILRLMLWRTGVAQEFFKRQELNADVENAFNDNYDSDSSSDD
jgi:hypothetical protein